MTGPPASPQSGTRLDAHLAAALSYSLGAITGIIFLLLDKDRPFVRFHALQAVVFSIVASILALMLLAMPLVGGLLYVAAIVTAVVIWIRLMFKALRGERYKLPYLGEFVEQQLDGGQ
jgi:uncharacterized membrane protein